MYSSKILHLSGLVTAGKDDLGQQLYVGTDEQWKKAEELRKSETYKISVKNLDEPIEMDIVDERNANEN